MRTVLLILLLGLAGNAMGQQVNLKEVLQGNWKPLQATLGGVSVPQETLDTITLELNDGQYRAQVGDQVDIGTWKLDTRKKPVQMMIRGTEGVNAGREIPAIVMMDGQWLKICYDLSGEAAPSDFTSSDGSSHYLVDYQRVVEPAP